MKKSADKLFNANQRVREDIMNRIAQAELTPEDVLDQIVSKMGWPWGNKYEQGGLWSVWVDIGEQQFGITIQDTADFKE